ncbi:MAG TPA: transporter substrate-binding protein [Candidatus Pacearchaeota archaeon]|jgi:urea transport system substrate-binding protein|nr:transporter substrate-binding protein [Candidatus Pacearchaeota archaeon]
MELKHLKEIGLTESQITVYEAILDLGTCTFIKIQERTGIERRNIYDILNKLITKGLVVFSIDKEKKTYHCTHPNKIKEAIESKKSNLESLEEQIPNILNLFNNTKQTTKIEVFRGEESIRALIDETLEYDSTYWLGGSSHIESTNLRFWFSQWMKIRSENKRNMYDLNNAATFLEDYPPSNTEENLKNLYNYSSLPSNMRLFNTILIFGNKVAQISWESQPFALVIDSKETKESYLRIFNHFWEESKESKSKSETQTKNPIKIGIIHSLTGTMAISEVSLVDTLLMAIEQINDKGGLLGRKIQPIIADGKSNGKIFAKEVERLIVEEEVCSIFGGWTSESRKTMKPIFEKYNHLLFYPLEYEGLEESDNIIYLGPTPNQQVIPAIKWAKKEIGNKFFLVGSDYIFPRSINEIIKNEAKGTNIKIIGEEYKQLGETNFKEIVKSIKLKNPDIIINTINGDSNIAFFNELKKQGISSKEIPTISMSLGEDEIRHIDLSQMTGNYSAWSYFQSLKNNENQKFIKSFKKRYGIHRVISDPMEKSYTAINLFTQAVKKAGINEVSAIKKAVKSLSIDSPEGNIKIDSKTQNTIQTPRIGKIKENGQFEIVWESNKPIKPEPYPKSKTKKQWDQFLIKLYKEWNNHWAKQSEKQTTP